MTRERDGKAVVDARLGLAVLLDALEPGAQRTAAADLIVVVSTT